MSRKLHLHEQRDRAWEAGEIETLACVPCIGSVADLHCCAGAVETIAWLSDANAMEASNDRTALEGSGRQTSISSRWVGALLACLLASGFATPALALLALTAAGRARARRTRDSAHPCCARLRDFTFLPRSVSSGCIVELTVRGSSRRADTGVAFSAVGADRRGNVHHLDESAGDCRAAETLSKS